MPLVTRTIVIYMDDELVEVDIDVEEEEEDNVNKNLCRICEKVELAGDNEIICPECWACCELVAGTENVSDKDDDDMSYRSFKEMVRQRNQSEISEISEIKLDKNNFFAIMNHS